MSDEKALAKSDAAGNTVTLNTYERKVEEAAAREEGIIKAQFGLAKRFPRDLTVTKQRLLETCKREGFAEIALYTLPFGTKKVSGPSIRLAEEMLKAMGNMISDATIVSESPEERTVRVRVLDLESLSSSSDEMLVQKFTEVRNAEGREVLSKRTNSQGVLVYRVAAREDEILKQTQAAKAKLKRNQILALAPRDILDAAVEVCRKKVVDTVAAQAEKWRESMVEAFAALGTKADDLAEYLGHPVAKSTPEEITELRGVYNAMKEGELNWNEARKQKLGYDPKTGEVGVVAPPAPAPRSSPPKDAAPVRSQDDVDAEALIAKLKSSKTLPEVQFATAQASPALLQRPDVKAAFAECEARVAPKGKR